MKIYLLEDNPIQMGRLENALAQELKTFGKNLSCVHSFDKPDQLLSDITSNISDQVFFLDIEIKGEKLKGLDIAKIIRGKNPYATIIFVATHSEYMPLVFDYQVSALDYIDKSLSEIEFRKKITRALAITMKPLGIENGEIFDFQTQHTAIRIPLNQVIYIETSPQKHYVILHGTNNQMTFRANLKDLEKASPSLVSCHRSYLINPYNIIRINKLKREVEMTDGSICPFSRTKAKMLMDTFNRRKLD